MENLVVKNMVCHRCVLAVEEILAKAKIIVDEVSVGEIHLRNALSDSERSTLQEELAKIGLELTDNRTGDLIERMKNLILLKARNEVSNKERDLKLSVYLSERLHHEYTYLSNLFSTIEGRTIENYFIEQRIEKAKELLVYGQMSLSEISYELDYSSVSHLSSQFKKVTGLTPSHFKKVGVAKRKALDQV
jgi:AraC-like DNA-binding protein